MAHCNGDAAAQQYLNCFNRATGQLDDAPDIRPVMIHAQMLRPDQLPFMKQLGMMPSFFVAHVYHWGEVHRENFGELRASRISPCKSALDQGIRFTFHQDSPVIQPDMIETIWCAAHVGRWKYDFLAVLGCLVLMGGAFCLTLAPLFWQEVDPERRIQLDWTAEQMAEQTRVWATETFDGMENMDSHLDEMLSHAS